MPKIAARPLLAVHEELSIALPEWAGFGAQLPRRAPRGGAVRVAVGGDAVLPDDAVPTEEQVAAYDRLFARAGEAQQAILRALAADDGVRRRMAAEVPGAALQGIIRLNAVHILNPHRDGEAYVGYQFSCGWDDEHGLGVMTHGGRVVAIGGADTAFLSWVAERDGGGDGRATKAKRSARVTTALAKKRAAKKVASKSKKPAAKRKGAAAKGPAKSAAARSAARPGRPRKG